MKKENVPKEIKFFPFRTDHPESILHKSIADRSRPIRVADGPIMARYIDL